MDLKNFVVGNKYTDSKGVILYECISIYEGAPILININTKVTFVVPPANLYKPAPMLRKYFHPIIVGNAGIRIADSAFGSLDQALAVASYGVIELTQDVINNTVSVDHHL